MKHKNYIIIVAILAVVVIVYNGRGKAETSEADRVAALSKIWGYAKDYYPCWDEADEALDWDKEYQKAIDRIKRAKSEYEVMCVLDEFRALMRDGHDGDYTTFFSKKELLGQLPFRLDYIEDQYVIYATVSPDQFPIGSVVEKINGMNAKQYIQQTVGKSVGLFTPLAREYVCGQKFCYGEKGRKVDITVKKADGSTSVIKTSWQNRRKNWAERHYETIGSQVYKSKAFEVYMSEEKICHVDTKTFETMDVFSEFQEKVLPIVKESRGVILDMRSNAGGLSEIGISILKYFCEGGLPELQEKMPIKISWDIAKSYIFGGEMRNEYPNYDRVYLQEKDLIDTVSERGRQMKAGKCLITGSQYEQIIKLLGFPAVQTSDTAEAAEAAEASEAITFVDIPCVILINHKSGSAVDHTAAVAKSAGFPLIGTRTKGATGTIASFDLGSGYRMSISTEYVFTPEGVAINNNGVKAGIYIEQSLEDEREQVDTQLKYAESYLMSY